MTEKGIIIYIVSLVATAIVAVIYIIYILNQDNVEEGFENAKKPNPQKVRSSQKIDQNKNYQKSSVSRKKGNRIFHRTTNK